MSTTDLDGEREAAIRVLTAAYAHDAISTEELERRLAAVTEAESPEAVRSVVSDLGSLAPEAREGVRPIAFPEGPQLLRGKMQSVRHEGPWLRSRKVRVEQIASSIRLDLSEIASHPGEVFELELALKGCSCRIRVPRGTRVEERIEGIASSYRCSRALRRGEVRGGPVLVLSGTTIASSVRVRPSRIR